MTKELTTLQEIGKQIDSIVKESMPALSNQGGFSEALELAAGIKSLREIFLTNPEIKSRVQAMANTPLGFMTDRTPASIAHARKSGREAPAPYTYEEVAECCIEAMLRGYRITGNEFNIMSGRFYAAKDGKFRKIQEWPGITDFKFTCTPPVYTVENRIRYGQAKQEQFAKLQCFASWKKDGTKQSLGLDPEASGGEQDKLVFKIKAYGDDDDGVIGKALSKLFSRVLMRISGQILPEYTDVDEIPGAVHVGPAAEEKPAETTGEVTYDVIEPDKTKPETVETKPETTEEIMSENVVKTGPEHVDLDKTDLTDKQRAAAEKHFTEKKEAEQSPTISSEYQVGQTHDFYSEKLKKMIKVTIIAVNKIAGKEMFEVEMIKPDGSRSGMRTMVSEEAMKKTASSETPASPAEPIKAEEFYRKREQFVRDLIANQARLDVTPDDVKKLLWAKIENYGWKVDHPEFLAYKAAIADQKQAEPQTEPTTQPGETKPLEAFTGAPTDRIGDDPEHIAIKRIMAAIKSKGLDDAGVKIAMVKPFGIASRSDLQIQNVQKFIDWLDELVPCKVLENWLRDGEKMLSDSGRGQINLSSLAIEKLRGFSPKTTGEIQHIYEIHDRKHLREWIMDSLDEWIAEIPVAQKQQELAQTASVPAMKNVYDVVCYAADLTGTPKDNPMAPKFTELAELVQRFIKEAYGIDEKQLANNIPEDIGRKLKAEFVEWNEKQKF